MSFSLPDWLNRESIGFVLQGLLVRSPDEAMFLRDNRSRTLCLSVICLSLHHVGIVVDLRYGDNSNYWLVVHESQLDGPTDVI